MIVRLPSAERYAPQVLKEQHWLPKLARHLSFQIPQPLALGKPSKNYPFNWSIYRWLDGESANLLSEHDMQALAEPLATCLRELHQVDCSRGPAPGPHNFFRGGNLAVYDKETNNAFWDIADMIDVDRAKEVWKEALRSKWQAPPVWVHGDVSTGNILVTKKKISALIDFGNLAVGDPACDLVMAWTDFNDDTRRKFKGFLPLDTETWSRARGWALWKAVITLAASKDKSPQQTAEKLRALSEILNDGR